MLYLCYMYTQYHNTTFDYIMIIMSGEFVAFHLNSDNKVKVVYLSWLVVLWNWARMHVPKQCMMADVISWNYFYLPNPGI